MGYQYIKLTLTSGLGLGLHSKSDVKFKSSSDSNYIGWAIILLPYSSARLEKIINHLAISVKVLSPKVLLF